jgi:hypothetical protein
MTVQDKIAALPPKCPSFEIVNGEVRYRYPERLFRAEAERDLALEVLRNFLEHSDGCQTILSTDLPCTCGANDARAVLAACGGEKP